MRPLATTKRILKWICMYPVEKSSDTLLWKTAARIMIIVMMFSITLFAIAVYAAFIIENMTTNLEDCLFTFMAFITCCGLIYTMIVAFFLRPQVPSIFGQIASIYDDRKYSFNIFIIEGFECQFQ